MKRKLKNNKRNLDKQTMDIFARGCFIYEKIPLYKLKTVNFYMVKKLFLS